VTTDQLSELINRRGIIEQHLFMIAAGKSPLPTAEDCKVMALKLGTPRSQWGDFLNNYEWGEK
jgi:NCAIR mutase (PurE)-related protein